MSDDAPLQSAPMLAIGTLEFYIDFEILRLLYQMNAGEDMDISVVDQNEKVSEIHAVRKKTRIDREVSVLSIKGGDVLKFYSGGVARCLLGEEVDSNSGNPNPPKDFFPGSSYEYVYLGQGSGANLQGTISELTNQKETQTELNLNDINSMQKTLSEGRQNSSWDKDGLVQTKCDFDLVETSVKVSEIQSASVVQEHDLIPRSSPLPRKRKKGRPRKFEGTNESVANVLDDAVLLKDPQYVEGTDQSYQDFGKKNVVNLTKSGRRVKKPSVLCGLFVADYAEKEDVSEKEVVHGDTEQTEKGHDAESLGKEKRKTPNLENESRTADWSDRRVKPKRGRRNGQQCPICGKIVNNMSSHIQVHDNPMKCNSCDKTFTQTHNLLRHISTMHQGKFPHTCHICGKGYTWNRSLLEHMAVTHGDGKSDQKTFFPRVHQCEECGRGFKNSSALRGHIDAIHKKLKSFACELCPKKFAKRYHLNVHRRTHSGEKPYLCSFCGKGFADKGNMDVHIQAVHLRHLPHKCDICNMEFRRKKFLTAHLERGHDNDGNPVPTSNQTSSVRKNTTARKGLKSTDSYQIVHYQMPDGSVVSSPFDALQIAVEEIKDSAMEHLEEQHLGAPSVLKTDPCLREDIQIRNAINAGAMQGVQQSEVPAQSLTLTVQNLTTNEVLESTDSEVAQFRQLLAGAAGQATNLQPGQAMPMDEAAEYVTESVETVTTSESAQQSRGPPQLSILKVEGDDQPYFLIQGQGGSITL